jgi:hypothetical protein
MTKRPIIRWERKTRPGSIYGPFTVFRASKTGGPLLKEEAHGIKDVNGFMIQTKTRKLLVEFRRRGN